MSDDENAIRQCSQCEKRAVVVSPSLCVDCYYKLCAAVTMRAQVLTSIINAGFAQADAIVPFGGTTPMMSIPEMPRPPMTLNNIKISGSTVGAINTGEVHKIDVNITELQNSGNTTVSNALTHFTQTVVNDTSIDVSTKNALLDQIEFLTEQAASAAKDRRPGMIKAAFEGVKSAALAVPTLVAAWNALEPVLKSFLHVG